MNTILKLAILSAEFIYILVANANHTFLHYGSLFSHLLKNLQMHRYYILQSIFTKWYGLCSKHKFVALLPSLSE